MDEKDIIQEIIGSSNNASNDNEFIFSIFNTIETNQNNMPAKITIPIDQFESSENLIQNEIENENGNFNSTERNNEIQLIAPFIRKKRLRKIFKTTKKKRSNASKE